MHGTLKALDSDPSFSGQCAYNFINKQGKRGSWYKSMMKKAKASVGQVSLPHGFICGQHYEGTVV